MPRPSSPLSPSPAPASGRHSSLRPSGPAPGLPSWCLNASFGRHPGQTPKLPQPAPSDPGNPHFQFLRLSLETLLFQLLIISNCSKRLVFLHAPGLYDCNSGSTPQSRVWRWAGVQAAGRLWENVTEKERSGQTDSASTHTGRKLRLPPRPASAL